MHGANPVEHFRQTLLMNEESANRYFAELARERNKRRRQHDQHIAALLLGFAFGIIAIIVVAFLL
jgi:hypothetical protein